MENVQKETKVTETDTTDRGRSISREKSPAPSKAKSNNEKRCAQDFYFGKLIGEGSFSSVYLAQDVHSKREYAIKTCEKFHIRREKKIQSIIREKEVMNLLNSRPSASAPFFVRLFYTFQCDSRLYFVMSYCKNGELLKWIKKKGKFERKCAAFYLAETLRALEHMHSLDIIHRDLKPENILLDDDMHVKISDFGSCKILNSSSDPSEGKRSSLEGTPQYVSPEVLEGNAVSGASDLWALGCILFQLMSGTLPFNNKSEFLIFKLIRNLDYDFPQDFDELARDLVEKLLVIDPESRLGALDEEKYVSLRKHPFLRHLDFNTLHLQEPPIICDIPREENDYTWPDNITTGFSYEREIGMDLPQTIIIPKVHKKDIKYLLNLPYNEQQALVEKQKETNKYHSFVDNNLILREGIIEKRKGLFWRRRMFILTVGPHLYYVDPVANVLKGQVPLQPDTQPDPKDFNFFYIKTTNRIYDLHDPNGTSHEWCQALDTIREHYFTS